MKLSQLRGLTKGLLAGCSLMCMFVATGCSFLAGQSTSVLSYDGPPSDQVDISQILDPIPRKETITRAGNYSPYTVLGKTYHVNFNPQGFTETGRASWYGTKFHGNKTANGEIYDMFAMTAAHKTLPIPSYVRVTNLDNGKQITVRVNDRGPFHDGRVIDLSYVAAKKLDILNTGTAPVKVELIAPEEGTAKSVAKTANTHAGAFYLQVGAFGTVDSANALRTNLASHVVHPVKVSHDARRNLYKVLVGPVSSEAEVPSLRAALQAAEIHETYLVQL